MKYLTVLLLSILLLAAASCAQPVVPTPTPAPTPVPPTPTPSPQDWLDRAVQGWIETESFQFTLELEGRTISLDEGGLLSFSSVEGVVQAPDRLQAETLITSPFGVTEVSYITIGDTQWLTNPLTGQWEEAPPELEADVTLLFDRQVGLGSVLADLENVERLPDQTINGTPSVHLRGTLPGIVLSDFIPDAPETVTVDLWVGTAEHYIHRVIITEPEEDGVSPTWTFNFSDFDADTTIEPPL